MKSNANINLVEGNRGAQKRVDDVGVVVKLLMHHEGKDAHLGGTAIVELDGLAAVLGNVRVGGLTVLLKLLLDGGKAKLNSTDGQEAEGEARGGKGVENGEASLHLVGAKGHASTGGGDDVAEDGKHGNAAMLGLDGTEAIEALLVSVVEQTKRIPEAKRRLGSKLGFEAHLKSRGSGHASHRSKGSNRCQDGKDSSNTEHFPR
mgnify:CR=1 FL=1